MNTLSVLGIIRHVLTFGGGILVSKGIVDDATAEQLVGAVVTISGFLWSVFAPEKQS